MIDERSESGNLENRHIKEVEFMKNRKRLHRGGCMLLAMALVLMPVGTGLASASVTDDSAIAQSEVTVKAQTLLKSGTCGSVTAENVKWVLDLDTGVLTFSGSGAMADYELKTSSGTTYSTAPWIEWSDYITSVVVESGVTTIGACAFTNCSYIKKVTLPTGITSIGSYAFAGCAYLTSITLPSSLTSVYDNAFNTTQSLTTIKFKGSAPEIGENAFYGTASTLVVYFPKAYASSYSSIKKKYGGTPTWTSYKSTQKITVKANSLKKTIKKSKLKKKAQTFRVTAMAKGKLTFTKTGGSSRIKIGKNGKVTVKKGTKKGTYKVTVRIDAKTTSAFKKASVTKTIKVKVK